MSEIPEEGNVPHFEEYYIECGVSREEGAPIHYLGPKMKMLS